MSYSYFYSVLFDFFFKAQVSLDSGLTKAFSSLNTLQRSKSFLNSNNLVLLRKEEFL